MAHDEQMGDVSPRVPVLHRLREDAEFSDCTVRVGDEEFSVHYNIVSCLAPFFKTALRGDFKEGATKRISIGDTTAQAVGILLDYAYEVDYTGKITADMTLTLDVWELANRFELKPLFNQCVDVAVKNVSCENAVQVLEKLRLYDCNQQLVERVVLFIAHNFEDTLFYASENVRYLSHEELLYFLKSEESIADEVTRFYTIMVWYRRRKNKTEGELEKLLEEVQFELLDTEAIDEILRDCFHVVPKHILGKMVYAATKRAVAIPQMFRVNPVQENTETISVPFSTTLCLEDKYVLKENLIFFKFARWLMSLRFEFNDEGQLCIILRCERRHSRRFTATSPLKDEIKGYSISIAASMAADGIMFSNSTTVHRNTFSRIISFTTDTLVDQLSKHRDSNMQTVLTLSAAEKMNAAVAHDASPVSEAEARFASLSFNSIR